MLLALLLLAAAVAARNGRWKQAVPLFVLTLLQPVLAIAGAAGGLHVLNAAAILVIASVLVYQAWRRDRRQPPGPAPEVGVMASPRSARRRRSSGKDSPMTLPGSPSMLVLNGTPKPSMLNA